MRPEPKTNDMGWIPQPATGGASEGITIGEGGAAAANQKGAAEEATKVGEKAEGKIEVTPELKPCPFCGNEPVIETLGASKGLVFCLDADCPASDMAAQQVDSWNRRTPDLTESLARLKALEEEIRDWPNKASGAVSKVNWAKEIAAIRKAMGAG